MAHLARNQTRRLGDYIERAYYPDNTNRRNVQVLTRKPFQDDSLREQPVLQRQGVNRILLFPGSFNPPHKGHVELMRYVFDHARDELNIVAIIIVLTDDDKLEEKTSEEANPLILTHQRRIALWRDKDVTQSCTWIYNKSQSEWAAFRSRLEKSTKKDGFDLQFILLVGPDCVGSAGITDPRVWNCRDCITSDISRPADFRGDNSMRQISAHTNWKKVEFYRYGIADRIRDRLKGGTQQETEKIISGIIARLDASWVCNRYFKPKGMIRFIQCDLAKRNDTSPSSKSIRALIETTPVDKLRQHVEALALSPQLLVDYIRLRLAPRPRPRVEQPREKTAEELEQERIEKWNKIVW